jgi:sterol 3beta-glucosyltransferase
MKIAITTLGTRGDLQPFIALALGLKDAGYDIVIISAKNEEDFVKSYGLKFTPLNVDIQKIMEGSEVQEMTKGDNPLKFYISHMRGSKKLKQSMVKTQHEIWDACQGYDAIIFHPGMPIGYFIAKELGKVSIMANPFPTISTKEYPSILFYNGPRFGRIYNLFTHIIFEKVFWALIKSAIKEFWSENVKTDINLSVPPIRQQVESGMPVLNGYSEYLFHKPKDWPDNIHTTGSWLIKEEPNWKPQPELDKFILTGQPPIFVGFGSMKDINKFKETFEIIIQALKISKQRAVVGLGWNTLKLNEPIPDNVFLIDNVPFTWLFQQMAAVVHHGGAGTTSIGLTAGKPTIIVPFNADQPAWGRRVFELGVGARPILKKKLTANKLASAIQYALNPEVVAKAEELGQKLRKENGVDRAVKIIDSFLRQKNTATNSI